jgi:hypothetical protein
LGLTKEVFEQACQRDDFPKAGRRTKFGTWDVTLIWRDTDLDRWRDARRAERDELTRLIGK